MQAFQFNHIALAVKDVNESIAFYQKVFGLKEIENTASNSKTRWLSLNEGKELHLIPKPEATVQVVKEVHFALATTDIHLFAKRLSALDILYSDWLGTPEKIHIRKDGIKQLYFQDPNGYWIEVNNIDKIQ
ncbi:MAG: VOC family protein [Flavobacteriaceae bacterium]